MFSECEGFARDPAKVEDLVRLLARTLNDVALDEATIRAYIQNQEKHERDQERGLFDKGEE
jgi:hypothetical protein